MYHAWKHLMEVGWSFEQPDLVEGNPAHCRGVGLRGLLKVPSNANYTMISK